MQNPGPHPDPLSQNLPHLLMVHVHSEVRVYWAEVCPGHLQNAPDDSQVQGPCSSASGR